MTNPSFRTLCAELLKGLDENKHEQVRYPGHLRLVMAEARALLEQPPADEEVTQALKCLLNAIEGWEIKPDPDDALAIAMHQAHATLNRSQRLEVEA